MSTVIALCSTNYCLMASDSRKVEFTDPNKPCVVASDNFPKIFKLNNNVLFGATGLFGRDEDIMSALDGVGNFNTFTLADAVQSAKEYLESWMTRGIYLPRNYILGGRENNSFAIYAVKFNVDSHTVTIDKRFSYLPSQHACLMALPQFLDRPEMEEKYLGMVSKIFAAPFTLNALKDGLSGVINCIAGDDEGGTVGGRPRFLTIT